VLRTLAAPRHPQRLHGLQHIDHRARRDLATAPTGALLPLSATAESTGEAADAGLPVAVPQAQRWAQALKRAERYGPWRGACLVRSMALHRLLVANGVPGSVVRVGVRAQATFEAHAWVEVGGVVVGDRPSVQQQWTPLGSSALQGGDGGTAALQALRREVA
jgi:hypothetical protein